MITDNTPTDSDNEHHENDDDTVQLLIFSLLGQEYSISTEEMEEIIHIPDNMEGIPKTADFIVGMVNFHGNVLPVIDMRIRIGLERMAQNDRQRIIVLSLDGTCTGFIVDYIVEVLTLPREKIEKLTSASADQQYATVRFVNLSECKRIIQVLTVHDLLSQVEIQVLDNNVLENHAKDYRENFDSAKSM